MKKLTLLLFFISISVFSYTQTDNDGCMDIGLRVVEIDFDYAGSNTDDGIGDEEHKIRLYARPVDQTPATLNEWTVPGSGYDWVNGVIARNQDGEGSYVLPTAALAYGNLLQYDQDVPVPLQWNFGYEYWEEDCFGCAGNVGATTVFGVPIPCTGDCGSSDHNQLTTYNSSCGCACDCIISGADDRHYDLPFIFSENIRDMPPGWTDRGWFDGDFTANSDRPRLRTEVYWSPPRPDELIVSETEVCSGTLIILASSGAEWNGDYVWEYNNASTGGTWTDFGTENEIQVFVVNETTNFRVRTQNGVLISGCDRQQTVVVKTESVEPASINASVMTTCPGNNVTLTAVGGTAGTGSQLFWFSDFCGGPPVGIGNSIVVSPSETTTYYCRYEDDCTTETLCTDITINVTPVPSPIASNIGACEGEVVTLEAFGSGGALEWYDGNVLLPSNNVGPFTAGTYVFSVLENTAGCLSEPTFVSVLITPQPATPSTAAVSVCEGENVILSATGSGSGTLNYYDNSGTQVSPTVGLLAAGTYIYTVTEDNGNCESVAANINVTVTESPDAPETDNVSACVGDNIMLTAIQSNLGSTLSWFDSAGNPTVANQGMLAAGSYTFTVRETIGSCQGASSTVVVTVSAVPSAPTTSAVAVCEGENVILSATASGSGTLNYYDNSGTQISPTVGLLAAGIYIYTVTEDNGACESTATTINVTVTQSPDAPETNNISACTGDNIMLTAIQSTSGSTISWFNSAGNPTTANQGMLAAGSYTFTVTETIGTCQSSSSTAVVTVSAIPAAPTATTTMVCVGENIVLSATGSGGGTLNYYDNSGTQVSPTVGLLAAGTYMYSVTEDNGNCESMPTTIMVTVSDTPVPPLAQDIDVCQGENVTLMASTSTGGTLSWFDNVGNPTTDAQGNALAAGTYTFSVTETNGGCVSQASFVTVTVAPTPAMPMIANINICEGTSTSIFAGSGTFNWYDDAIGGTAIFSGSTFDTPVLLSTEDYYVSEVVGDCEGPRGQVDVIVTPNLATPNITSNSPVCAGSTIQLTTDFNADYTYSWTGPNGYSSNLQNPQILNASSNINTGTYGLIVTDVNTGCIASNSVIVNVTPNPQSVPLFSNSPVCEGDDIILSTAGLAGATYTWIGPGGNLGTTNTPEFTITAVNNSDAGTYTVSVEVSGCSSSATSTQVNIQAAPNTPTAANNGPVCEGESITISTSVIPGASYLWTGPNGVVGSASAITINDVSVSDAGSYTLVVTENGCESNAAITNVSIDAAPIISSTITNNGPLCEGETLIIDAPTVAGVNYLWTGPGGLPVNSVEDPSIINVSDADHQGTYTLVLVDQTTGCESMPLSTFVQIDATPSGLIAGNSGVACVGQTISLTTTGVFGATYDWTGPNGFTSIDQNPVINNVTLADAGFYMLEVTVGDCVSAALETNVIINTGPTVNAGLDVTVLQGESIQLLGTGAISYNWTATDYLNNPSIANPIFSGAPVGVYTYTVTGFDSNGCSGTDEVVVTVQPNENLEIVDLFTPNGDGVNDTWAINYLENLKDGYTIKVYARGGNQVLETDNYSNEWDGTLDGNSLPDGTYWYVIKAVNGPTFKGAVTIKR